MAIQNMQFVYLPRSTPNESHITYTYASAKAKGMVITRMLAREKKIEKEHFIELREKRDCVSKKKNSTVLSYAVVYVQYFKCLSHFHGAGV